MPARSGHNTTSPILTLTFFLEKIVYFLHLEHLQSFPPFFSLTGKNHLSIRCISFFRDLKWLMMGCANLEVLLHGWIFFQICAGLQLSSTVLGLLYIPMNPALKFRFLHIIVSIHCFLCLMRAIRTVVRSSFIVVFIFIFLITIEPEHIFC